MIEFIKNLWESSFRMTAKVFGGASNKNGLVATTRFRVFSVKLENGEKNRVSVINATTQYAIISIAAPAQRQMLFNWNDKHMNLSCIKEFLRHNTAASMICVR